MGLLRTKQAAPASSPGAGIVIPNTMNGRPVERPWSRGDLAKTATSACETAANCLVFRGDAVAKAPFGRKDGDQFDPTHPLSLLFSRPNAWYSQSDYWHQVMYTLLADEGGVFTVVPLNNAGLGMELWVRNGKSVRPVADSEKFVRGFQMLKDNQWRDVDPDQYLIWQNRFVPWDVDNLFGSWPPLARAARSVKSFAYLGDWVETLLRDRTIFDGFITTKSAEGIDPSKIDAIEKRILDKLQGPNGGGGYRFLPGNLDFVEISAKLSDVDPGETQDRLETSICASFQLNPVSVRTHAGMDISGGLGGDKIQSLITQDYEGTITSDWNLLTSDAATALAERYGLAPEEVGFDLSGVKELDESEDAKFTRYKGAWWMSADDVRAKLGDEPSDHPLAKVPFIAVQAAARAQQTAPPPAEPTKVREVPPFESKAAERLEVLRKAVDDVAVKHEAEMLKAARAIFATQRKAVLASVSKYSGNALELKADDVTMPDGEWSDFEPFIGSAMEDAAALQEDALHATFSLTSKNAIAAVRRRVDKLADVDETTRSAIQNVIAQGREDGATLKEITEAIGTVFDQAEGYRAEMIARTESIGAANEGGFILAADATEQGIEVTKTWISFQDARTRESHILLDGVTINGSEPFDNGLMFPGDPDGDPEEVINCRCSCGYEGAPPGPDDQPEG